MSKQTGDDSAFGVVAGSAIPSTEDQRRAIAIRMASKRGQYVSSEDMKFCTRLWKKYPDWYASTEADVFNATVPFGSNVRASSPNIRHEPRPTE